MPAFYALAELYSGLYGETRPMRFSLVHKGKTENQQGTGITCFLLGLLFPQRVAAS